MRKCRLEVQTIPGEMGEMLGMHVEVDGAPPVDLTMYVEHLFHRAELLTQDGLGGKLAQAHGYGRRTEGALDVEPGTASGDLSVGGAAIGAVAVSGPALDQVGKIDIGR